MNKGELILYQTDDGLTTINLRAIDGTVWLTQKEIANLFDISTDNVGLHLKEPLKMNDYHFCHCEQTKFAWQSQLVST